MGILFPEFKRAKKWRRKGLKELLHELKTEVHEDGVDFEGSVSYHRLVLEMFVSALILCRRNNITVPETVWRHLEKMFEFVLSYTKPNGMSPQVGDTDNGRLQTLSRNEVMDHRYLLSIGAVLFGRSDFKKGAGKFHEEAFWLLGEEGIRVFDSIHGESEPVSSKSFEQGGLYFLKNERLYMVVDCGPNGRRGVGDHSHNDTLSFELYAYDKSFIVDPGTYIYSADPRWRNLFRSTAFHNTVVADGKEINRIDPDQLFATANDASPKVNRWKTSSEADFLDAQHNGYERLRDPVTHRRQFYFGKAENYWVIRDLVTGKGEHTLSWHFHFDMGIPLSIRDEGTIETFCQEGANLILQVRDHPKIDLDVIEGWVSPSYGIKEKAQVARCVCSGDLPISITFIIFPYTTPDSKERYFGILSEQASQAIDAMWGIAA